MISITTEKILAASFLFLGRDPAFSNPGAPKCDSDFEEKSKNLALSFCKDGNPIIISPNSDHSRKICILDSNQLYLGDHCRIPTPGLDDWSGTSILMDEIPENTFVISVPGDGVIVQSPNPTRTIVLQLRTRDCTPIIGGTTDAVYFIPHLSAETLFGWTSAKNNQYQHFKDTGGSILHKLFKLVDPTKCTVFVGPSISGIRDNCQCYEYTETLKDPDGSLLLAGVTEEYPGLNIDSIYEARPEDGKMDIDWGNLVLEVLKQYGVAHIDTRHNYCTQCNPRQFYSYRATDSESLDPLDQKLLEEKTGNIAMLVIPPTQ